MLLSDKSIKRLSLNSDRPLLLPFVEHSTSVLSNGQAVPSFGLSSYGYDLSLGTKFKVMKNASEMPEGTIIDPSNFDANLMKDVVVPEGDFMLIQPGACVLAVAANRIIVPRDVAGVCMQKSTLARVFLDVMVTPLEPGWEGYLTLEMHNKTQFPVKLWPGMGIVQLLFYKGDEPCEVAYNDRKGKYQDQPNEPVAAKQKQTATDSQRYTEGLEPGLTRTIERGIKLATLETMYEELASVHKKMGESSADAVIAARHVIKVATAQLGLQSQMRHVVRYDDVSYYTPQIAEMADKSQDIVLPPEALHQNHYVVFGPSRHAVVAYHNHLCEEREAQHGVKCIRYAVAEDMVAHTSGGYNVFSLLMDTVELHRLATFYSAYLKPETLVAAALAISVPYFASLEKADPAVGAPLDKVQMEAEVHRGDLANQIKNDPSAAWAWHRDITMSLTGALKASGVKDADAAQTASACSMRVMLELFNVDIAAQHFGRDTLSQSVNKKEAKPASNTDAFLALRGKGPYGLGWSTKPEVLVNALPADTFFDQGIDNLDIILYTDRSELKYFAPTDIPQDILVVLQAVLMCRYIGWLLTVPSSAVRTARLTTIYEFFSKHFATELRLVHPKPLACHLVLADLGPFNDALYKIASRIGYALKASSQPPVTVAVAPPIKVKPAGQVTFAACASSVGAYSAAISAVDTLDCMDSFIVTQGAKIEKLLVAEMNPKVAAMMKALLYYDYLAQSNLKVVPYDAVRREAADLAVTAAFNELRRPTNLAQAIRIYIKHATGYDLSDVMFKHIDEEANKNPV